MRAASHPPRPERTHACSFCGKSQHEVERIIAGPKVDICNECVAECNDILKDQEVAPLTMGEKAKSFRRSIEQMDELIAEVRSMNAALQPALVEIASNTAKAIRHLDRVNELGMLVTGDVGPELDSTGQPRKEAGPRDLFDLVTYEVKSTVFTDFPCSRSTHVAVEILPARGLPFDTAALQLNLSAALSPSLIQTLADRLSLALLNTLQASIPDSSSPG